MTVIDKPRFAQAFNRLAVSLRLPIGEADAAMQRVYYDALDDLPVDALEDAARELAREAEWFPKTSEWRSVAERARNMRALTAGIQDRSGRIWHAECQTCDDTGWEALTCAGGRQCGREKEHAAHDYVVPCACRDTNHTYQRRRAEVREQARGRKAAEA